MGVRFYIKFIKDFCKRIIDNKIKFTEIELLLIDLNSIVYDCLLIYIIESKNKNLNLFIDKIVYEFGLFISQFSNLKKLYIAGDGVAPLAKMQQQRVRRYKSPKTEDFDNALICPGTSFMILFDQKMTEWCNKNKENFDTLVYSNSTVVKEGEQKIVDWVSSGTIPIVKNKSLIICPDSDIHIILLTRNNPILDNLSIYFGPILCEKTAKLYSSAIKLEKRNTFIINVGQSRSELENYFFNIENIDPPQYKMFWVDFQIILSLYGNDFVPGQPFFDVGYDAYPKNLSIFEVIFHEFARFAKNNEVRKDKIKKDKNLGYLCYRTPTDSETSVEIDINEFCNFIDAFNLKDIVTVLFNSRKNSQIIKGSNFNFERYETLWYYREFNYSIYKNYQFSKIKELSDKMQISKKAKTDICRRYLLAFQWCLSYYLGDEVNYKFAYTYNHAPLMTTFSALCKELEWNKDEIHKCQTNLTFYECKKTPKYHTPFTVAEVLFYILPIESMQNDRRLKTFITHLISLPQYHWAFPTSGTLNKFDVEETIFHENVYIVSLHYLDLIDLTIDFDYKVPESILFNYEKLKIKKNKK